MTLATDIVGDLERLSGSADEFEAHAYGVTNFWIAAGVGIEAVDSILRFMEAHTSMDRRSRAARPL